MSKVVIVGAGVIGLTTAAVLLENGYKNVTIVGKYHPGDEMTHEFTSPWAGASIVSFAGDSKLLQEIDKISFEEFNREADHEPEAGVMYCPGVHYSEVEDPPAEAWPHHLYRNVKAIPKDKLPEGVCFGYTFVSFTTHAPRYLDWLVKKVKALGATIERGTFDSIQQVIDQYSDADVVVNCTGLGSRFLTDVRDPALQAVRGQTVLVHAPHVKTQHYREGPDVYTYIIPRPDGTVICGGTLDYNNTSTEPSTDITKSILKRCYDLYPDITHGKGPEAFDVVRQNVGFRPTREGSIRIEAESRAGRSGLRVTVVHNYGHGAHGYQSSWGSAVKTLELIRRKTATGAKL